MADNFGGYYAAQREENKRQREIADLRRERSLREARGDQLTEEEQALYQEQLQSREFSSYRVTTLPNKPENYGRGPSKSTRVSSHKFVPGSKTTDQALGRAVINSGTVYVKFARPSKLQGGDATYKYSNVPVATYESFRSANSKGRFINNPLESYGYSKVDPSSEEYGRFCSDL
jgi:hypothetical protein